MQMIWLAAVLGGGLCTPESVSVGEVREERRDYLKGKYGVSVTGNNGETVGDKDVIVLAVKPQNLAEAISLILEDRREDALRGVPADATREIISLR